MPDNPTGETVELHWVYLPADFFEEKIVRDCESYSIEIEGGHITARISAEFFDTHLDLPSLLRRDLNSYFLGAQLIRRKVFEIDDGAVDRLWPDGRKNTTLAVQCAHQLMLSDQVDLVQLASKGAVVGDTRRDRIEATKNLAQLSVLHASDPTAHRMLESHAASIATLGEELVYLYEIWDALKANFQRRENARSVLNISPETLTRFDDLTCNLPLRQGRHRGRFDTLRDATAGELDEARRIAQDMMERYWRYLDDPQKAK